ncbi:MAG: hypothetical protein A2031_08265 [Deltaproteobacteria bacterium RBG_19FT_COMBO_43_11]|nr:MAG: hypothetical protein A2W27_08210 [Deltaproteobacteria bacterium RBG_16_44_11]OGP87189.1 MAG: hypothetical protein A2031_08265 [Deltaproteobacteria bacterium RBG_19FT_COMBO_43_11]
MMSIWHVLILISAGVVLALICVIVGGWLVFKSKAAPGEGLFKEPKGQVFSITDGLDNEEFPEGNAEKSVLEKTKKFLDVFTGGKEQ